MTTNVSWNNSYGHDINTTPQLLWQALADIDNWKRWNPGVKSIDMKGAFVTGTWFSMELPDGEVIRSELVDVVALRHFVDETRMGETVIRVEHRIEALREDLCRVTYTVNVEGADAQAIGEGVSADFPEVLAGLAKYVDGKAM